MGYYLECDKICEGYYDRRLREYCHQHCRFLVEEQRKIFENIVPKCIPERLRYELFKVVIGNKVDPETYSLSYVSDRLVSILQEASGTCPKPLLEDFLFKYVDQLWINTEARNYILNTVRRQLADIIERPVNTQIETLGPSECIAICGGLHDVSERNNCIRRCLSILSHRPLNLSAADCMSGETHAELYTLVETYRKYPRGLDDWQIVSRVSTVISKLLNDGCRKDEASRIVIEALDQAGVPRHRIMRAYLHGTKPEVIEVLYTVFPHLLPLYRPMSLDLLEKPYDKIGKRGQYAASTTFRKGSLKTTTRNVYMISIANLFRAVGFLLLFVTFLDVIIKYTVTYTILQVMLIGYILSTLLAPFLFILSGYRFILSHRKLLYTGIIGFLGLVPLAIYMWKFLQLNPTDILPTFTIPWLSTSIIIMLQALIENWARGASYAVLSMFGIGYLLLAISKAHEATMNNMGRVGIISFLVSLLVIYLLYLVF